MAGAKPRVTMSVTEEITNSILDRMLLEAEEVVGGEPYKCWYCSHTAGLKCCSCGVKPGAKHLPRGVVEENMAMMKVVHGAIAKKKIDGIVAAEVEKQCRIRDVRISQLENAIGECSLNAPDEDFMKNILADEEWKHA